MKKRKLGRTGLDVSACCLGTMTFGQQNTEAEGHQQMDYAVDRGVNFFDTAELYSIPPKPETQGSTEKIVGTWLKSRGQRDQVIVATKIVGRSKNTWFRSFETDVCRIDKRSIDDAIEGSLRRLQTDYIDLYQFHWPDRPANIFGHRMSPEQYEIEYTSFRDLLDHLDTHVKAGRIRHFGVSNESPFGVMRFLAESDAHDLPRVASIQNAYSLVNREFEVALEEIAMREQVGLLAYSPLAQGYLSGKYRGGALPEGSRKHLFERLSRYESDEGQLAIESYLNLADRFGVNPAQLAIKFCDTRSFMTSTIIGATTMGQLKTCIDAFELQWLEEFALEIDKLHKKQPSPCP